MVACDYFIMMKVAQNELNKVDKTWNRNDLGWWTED